MTNVPRRGIDRAIRAAGSQTKLADRLGCTQQAISAWQKRGWVPLLRGIEIESIYGIDRRLLVNPRIAELVKASAEV